MNQPQGRMVPFVMVTVLGLVAVVPVFSLAARGARLFSSRILFQ